MKTHELGRIEFKNGSTMIIVGSDDDPPIQGMSSDPIIFDYIEDDEPKDAHA